MGVVGDTERGRLRGGFRPRTTTATQTGTEAPPTGRTLPSWSDPSGVVGPRYGAAEARAAGRPWPLVRARSVAQYRPRPRLCGHPEEDASVCRPDAPRASCARRRRSGAIRAGWSRSLPSGGDRGPAAAGGRPDVNHPMGPSAPGIRTVTDRPVRVGRAVAYLEFLLALSAAVYAAAVGRIGRR